MKLKALSKTEIADLYGITLKTFNHWLKKAAGKVPKKPAAGLYYNVKEVEQIFNHFGEPEKEITISTD